jgi:hypothetical protein
VAHQRARATGDRDRGQGGEVPGSQLAHPSLVSGAGQRCTLRCVESYDTP